MRTIFERIMVCWYVLTMKEYFFASGTRKKDNSGLKKAACYYDTLDTKESHIFFDSVAKVCTPGNEYSCINDLK